MFQQLIALDIQISLFFRSLVLITDPLARYIPILSDSEVFLVMIFLVAWWLRGRFANEIARKIEALDVLYAIAFAFAVYWVLNFWLPVRPRPELQSGLPPLIAHYPDNSFPSGHAIFAGASVYAIARFVSKKIALVFWILWLAMLAGRVISGVHYFGDVLVGFVLGLLCGYGYAHGIRKWISSETHPIFTLPVKIASIIRL